jgi:hypothetical protein
MRARLLETFGRLWTSFRRRCSPAAVNVEREEKDGVWTAARARFWTEFREGQREADAHRSRPR